MEENIEIINDYVSSTTEISNEKLETKGLKLKKSTKERLNTLQSAFNDAETMISTLITQYESSKIESDNRFSDRKAEIDKFNYLIDSLKNTYLNSLDMATYIEDKHIEKFQIEIKKREQMILSIQEENNKVKKNINELNKNFLDKELEVQDLKDNFTNINLLLSTVENDSKEKSKIIADLQNHINTLSNIVDIQKTKIAENDNLINENNKLVNKIQEYEYNLIKNSNLKEEISVLKEEILNLKEELKTERTYSNTLNSKIHEIYIEKSMDINKIIEDNTHELKEIQKEYNQQISNKNIEIDNMKSELYELKIQLHNTK